MINSHFPNPLGSPILELCLAHKLYLYENNNTHTQLAPLIEFRSPRVQHNRQTVNK